jgi:acyl carrier protein
MSLRTTPEQGSLAPERAAVEWLREALEDNSITADENFLALGGHSMMAIELKTWLEEHYGIDVGLAALFRKPLGGAIADATMSSPWLTRAER